MVDFSAFPTLNVPGFQPATPDSSAAPRTAPLTVIRGGASQAAPTVEGVQIPPEYAPFYAAGRASGGPTPPSVAAGVSSPGRPSDDAQYFFSDPVSSAVRGLIQSNRYTSALAQGINTMGSLVESGVGAGVRAAGFPDAANRIGEMSKFLGSSVPSPELAQTEAAPWTGPQSSFGGDVQKAITGAVGAVPYVAAAMAAGPGEAAEAAPGVMGRLSAYLPRVLGGSGSTRAFAGAAAATVPATVGSLEQQNEAQPGGPTQAGAVKALALGVPVGAAQALLPGGVLTKTGGGIIARVAGMSLGGAAAGAVGTGLQTAAEMSMRPDIKPADKMSAIVDSVVGGAASGGLMGGVFGGLHGANPPIKALDDYTREAVAPDQAPPEPVEPTAPVPGGSNSVANQIAQGAGVKIEEVPLLQNLKAATLPEAVNEIAAHPEAANHPGVLSSLGIGRDLDNEITQHLAANPQAAAGGPGAAQLTELTRLADLRNQAAVAPNAANAAPTVEQPGEFARAIARASGAPIGDKSKGVFADFVRGSQATSEPALYNETQDAIAKQSPVTQTKSFDKLVQRLTQRPGIVEEAQALRQVPASEAPQPTTEVPTPSEAEGAPAVPQTAPIEAPVPTAQTGPVETLPANETTIPSQPTSIADRVLNVARELAGDKGGQVDIGAIRQAMPDVAKPDLDNALRQVHADDTGSELVKAPVGQRDGRDGVTLGDSGKFHILSIEPQGGENAAQEPSAAGVDVGQLPQNGGPVGEGNAQGNAPTQEVALRPVGEGPVSRVANIGAEDVGVAPEDVPSMLSGDAALRRAGLSRITAPPSRTLGGDITVSRSPDGNFSLQPRSGAGNDFLAEAFKNVTGDLSEDDLQRMTAQARAQGLIVSEPVPSVGERLTTSVKAFTKDEGASVPRNFDDAGIGKIVRDPSSGQFNVQDNQGGVLSQHLTRAEAVAQRAYLLNRAQATERVHIAETRSVPHQVAAATDTTQNIVNPIFDRIQTSLDAFVRDENGFVKPQGVSDAVRKTKILGMSLRTLNGLARAYPDLPAIKEGFDLSQARVPFQINASAAGVKAGQDFLTYAHLFPKAGEIVLRLMRATELGFDPLRPWADHTWLHNEPNAAALKAELGKVQAEYNKLGQPYAGAPAGMGQGLYKALAASMRSTWLGDKTEMLHDFVYRVLPGHQLPGFTDDPMRTYNFASQLHDDPHATEAFWRAQYQARMASVRQYLKNQRAAAATSTKRAMSGQVTDLAGLVNMISQSEQSQLLRGQYFHLGRQGDYGVSMHFRPDPTALKVAQATATATGGKVNMADLPPDPAAITEAQKRMDDVNLRNVSLNTLSTQRHAFMRFKGQDDGESMLRVAQELHKDGFLEQAPTSHVIGKEDPLNSGLAVPAFFDRFMASAKESLGPLTKDPKMADVVDTYLNEVRGALMDALPTTTWRQALLPRKNVQGFDSDMMRSYFTRMAMHGHAMGSMATAREFAEIGQRLQQQVRSYSGQSFSKLTRAQDAANEYFQHMAAVSSRVPHSITSALTALTHSAQLGLSGQFVGMQLAQPWMMSWPELAKKFGAVRSAQAMAAVMPDVLRVSRAMWRNRGLAITPKVLADAGISADRQKFLMDLVNWGVLELGATFSRDESYLTKTPGEAIQGKYNNALRVANTTATGSEIWGRLQTALAAHKLWMENPTRATGFNGDRVEYARHVLNEGMFPWGTYDTPRAFNNQGPLGGIGPLVGQFKQFQVKYIEKFMHEMHSYFTEAGIPKQEAARYLRAHLTFAMVNGGVLGLPMAGLAAAAATRLTGLLNGGQSWDVEQHLHEFFEMLAGKTYGKILASGLPRALGVDTHDWGPSDMPFQDLLEDRRSLQDSWGDHLSKAMGAGPSFLLNAAFGMQDIANGQYLRGASKALPRALRSLVGAYRMVGGKYVNQEGVPLPMSADATDILQTALGLTPGKYAEYEEKNREAIGLSEERKTRAGYLELNLAQAVESGNPQRVQTAMAAAQQFDADPLNRGLPVLRSFMTFEENRRRQAATAQSLGIPLGTNPKDLTARQMVNSW